MSRITLKQSPFIRKTDGVGNTGVAFVTDGVEIFKSTGLPSKPIAALCRLKRPGEEAALTITVEFDETRKAWMCVETSDDPTKQVTCYFGRNLADAMAAFEQGLDDPEFELPHFPLTQV